MKQLVVLIGCAVVLLGFVGCQSTNKRVEVIIEDGGQFPEFLVGTWKANKGGWEIVFEPDGTISSAVIPLGRTKVAPGQTTVVPMKLGGKGVYKAGNWLVQYSPVSRELTVEIVIESFRAQIGPSAVKGSTRDYLTGTVSEDGKLWDVAWLSVPKYIVDIPERRNQELPIDPYYNEAKTVLFEKVVEN